MRSRHRAEEGVENADQPKERFPWPIRLIIFACAGLLGLLNHFLHDWGIPASVAAAAILVPLFGYRTFWHRPWFWSTMLALSVLQVPLVIAARPLMDQFRFAFNLLFGLTDCLLVVIVVRWVAPKAQE
jgi:hypothetical protein